MHGYEEDMPATPMDAVREWVAVVGANHPNRAWLCHDYDVWVANPYYVGPPVRHPEDDSEDHDTFEGYGEAGLTELGEALASQHEERHDDVPF